MHGFLKSLICKLRFFVLRSVSSAFKNSLPFYVRLNYQTQVTNTWFKEHSKNIHFDRGRSSPFGEVGYAAPFDGKLTKSLELKLLLKFALVDVYNHSISLHSIAHVKLEADVVIVFSISCFMFIFGDVKCEAFIAKYFGLVRGTCICGLKRIAGLALGINMYCWQCHFLPTLFIVIVTPANVLGAWRSLEW